VSFQKTWVQLGAQTWRRSSPSFVDSCTAIGIGRLGGVDLEKPLHLETSASFHCSKAVEDLSAVPTQSFNPLMIWGEGRQVICPRQQLRLHPALQEIGWIGVIDEFNDALRLKDRSVLEPILITTKGIILTGIERWRSAVFDSRDEINCVEYSISHDEALHFILAHHQSRRGWNAFIRIRLALTLEPHFQQRALDNMRTGGKHKGSANLPEAQRMDVRQEIARAAGVGTRNVSKVKTIISGAHQRLKDALRDGTLTINHAHKLCELPKTDQQEQFVRYCEERATKRVIRRYIAQPGERNPKVDIVELLKILQTREARAPGSLGVRIGQHKSTVVLVGRDLIDTLGHQGVELL
jgi:hypothetical protein